MRIHSPIIWLGIFVLTVAAMSFPRSAAFAGDDDDDDRARTPPPPTLFTVPHFFTEPDIAGADTLLHVTYTGGLADGGTAAGATFDLYIYSRDTGRPLLSDTGFDVCSPCSFAFGSGGATAPAPRMRTLSLIELGQAAVVRGHLRVHADCRRR